MVDFNSEGTISKPPREVVALIIIEKLYNFLEADEDYSKKNLSGAGGFISISRARLRSLFLVCHQMLERRCTKEEFTKLTDVCIDLKTDTEIADIMDAFKIILKVLDDLQLIKLDTKPVYNRHRTEEANKHHGYG